MYCYDERGDLTLLVEPDGKVTAFHYDEDRRLAAVTHPDGGLTTYVYGQDDRLEEVGDRGVTHLYKYDADGRLARARHGRSGAHVYRYTQTGQLAEARAGAVTTCYDWPKVSCACDGVTVGAELEYGADGWLQRLCAAGAELRYAWDDLGRLASVEWAGETLVQAEYRAGAIRLRLGNGQIETREYNEADGRPRKLNGKRYDYRADGRLAGDGVRRYTYDEFGRLETAEERGGRRWRYAYDALGNRAYDGPDRLVHDDRGRLIARFGPNGEASYRYDDADRLVEACRDGVTVGRFTYDHAGRLVRAWFPERVERYLYSLDGTLLAVTDDAGAPVRIPVRTPLGVLAELRPDGVRYQHTTCGPYGEHLSTKDDPVFQGHTYYPELGLYDFGTRWYDPELGRFLTPDSYTGRPDDARLVHPFGTGQRQVAERSQWLSAWLAKPRERNRYAFCCGDPVNRFDPDGHWSFGWLLLSLLGAVWTLPNTLIGVLLEISCLIGEPIRWIMSALGRAANWQPVGFDAATSSRLDAFALVFVGGWMGTLGEGLAGFQAITFGNVFFLNRKYTKPKSRLYEHELRHTNQYGWFGPLFLVVYLIDYLAHGYDGSLLELDAQTEEGP